MHRVALHKPMEFDVTKHQSVSARRAARTAKADAKRANMVTPEQVAAIKRLDAIGKEIEVKLIKADKANDMLISVNELLVALRKFWSPP